MQQYNPKIHHRKSIRLKGHDYSGSGLYFITICCDDRMCRFGQVENGKTVLNEYGQIAYDEWVKLPERFPGMALDAFQIMPNHIHGIIELDVVGATLAVAQHHNVVAPHQAADFPDNQENPGGQLANHDVGAERAIARVAPQDNIELCATARVAPTVSEIIGGYKSLVSNGCLSIYKTKNLQMGKLWQRNYYEHIIRNEQSYQNIRQYIIDNPLNWAADKLYIK